MIHERKLDKHLHINGPLTTCVATVTAALHEIEASVAIQNEGFENLIRGSKVTMEEVLSRAPGNWYIEANEANSRAGGRGSLRCEHDIHRRELARLGRSFHGDLLAEMRDGFDGHCRRDQRRQTGPGATALARIPF